MAYQRAILILAIAGIAVFVGANPASAGAFFIPACLAVLHGLSYPWPRFNQPAMPILIASAGAFVVWAARQRGRRAVAIALAVLLSASVLLTAMAGTRMILPELARVLRFLGIACGIAAPFAYAALASGSRSAIAGLGLGLVVLLWLAGAHELRSRTWHETELRLGAEVPEVQQEIELSPEGRLRLRKARESFVVFDLRILDGDPRGLKAFVNGREIPPDDWIPTMPRFGESTAAGGRDRRGYRQWWAVRLPPEVLASTSVHVALRSTGREPIVVYGDRFREQESGYEGPSFGDWPHLAAVKLEYDGDYRLPVRRRLESARTSSFVVSGDGSRSKFPGVHRIRILELGMNEGRLSWETAALPSSGEAAIGFFAYSGKSGSAELLLGGTTAAKFPLGSAEDFEVDFPPHRLCHRAEPARGDMAYGGYVLFAPLGREGPIALTVRFLSGMSAEPLFFSLDQREDKDRLAALLARCRPPSSATSIKGIEGVGRILDATANHYPEDTGRWSVVSVH